MKRTLDYLIKDILERKDQPFAEVHKFFRDRSRSIRQDFTLQNIRDRICIEVHEKIARFHIFSGHRLCEEDPGTFDAFQNTEQLRKVLQSLWEFYNDEPEPLPNEPEFRGYYFLTHLQDDDVLRKCLDLKPSVFSSDAVQFAIATYSSLKQNNYVRFFNLVREGTYFQACLMHSHFTIVRRRALRVMSKVYVREYPFPVDDLARILGFEDADETVRFCEHHGIAVGPHQSVLCLFFDKDKSFIEPEGELPRKRADRLIEAKTRLSNSQIVDGELEIQIPLIRRPSEPQLTSPSSALFARRSIPSMSPAISTPPVVQNTYFWAPSAELPHDFQTTTPSVPSLPKMLSPVVAIQPPFDKEKVVEDVARKEVEALLELVCLDVVRDCSTAVWKQARTEAIDAFAVTAGSVILQEVLLKIVETEALRLVCHAQLERNRVILEGMMQDFAMRECEALIYSVVRELLWDIFASQMALRQYQQRCALRAIIRWRRLVQHRRRMFEFRTAREERKRRFLINAKLIPMMTPAKIELRSRLHLPEGLSAPIDVLQEDANAQDEGAIVSDVLSPLDLPALVASELPWKESRVFCFKLVFAASVALGDLDQDRFDAIRSLFEVGHVVEDARKFHGVSSQTIACYRALIDNRLLRVAVQQIVLDGETSPMTRVVRGCQRFFKLSLTGLQHNSKAVCSGPSSVIYLLSSINSQSSLYVLLLVVLICINATHPGIGKEKRDHFGNSSDVFRTA